MASCKICGKGTILKYRDLFDNRHGYLGYFDIYECATCGFMQTNPQLGKRQLTALYTKYYPKRDASIDAVVRAGQNLPTPKEIYSKGLATTCHFATKPGERVLDVGSGACYSLVEIRTMGGEAWGIDPDANAKKVAVKLKLKFHQGFLDNCPFPKHYFDLITASQVIEHEPDPLKFLILCKKFLKPAGRIRLSFPNTGALFRHVWGRNWLHWHVPYHLNHFNRKSFQILADKAGLKIIDLKTATPNLWTVLQVRSWLNHTPMGQRGGMWDGVPSPSSRGSAALAYIDKLGAINRLLDALGWGESSVVELEHIEPLSS